MTNPVVVHKGRTNIITVNLGIDVTGDTFTSEIRTEPEVDSTLIAAWDVTIEDATNGVLKLEMDDLVSGQVTVSSGYMDIKRVTGGEPVPVFDEVLEVAFRGVTTA